jgi:tetratricopeptide (TPR) repeat protein
MKPRRVHRLVSWVAALVLAALLFEHTASAQPATAEPPVPKERQERLKERNRLWEAANQLRQQGKLAEAVAAVEKVLAIERAVLGKTHADVADSLELLAKLHEEREDFAAAHTARQEILALRRNLHGEGHWRVTDAQLALADMERLATMKPAQRRRLGEAERLNTQAMALYRQGKFRETIASAQEALGIRKQLLGEQHHDYAQSLNILAMLYQAQGHYVHAEPLYRQALAIYKQALGEQHPAYATSLHNLAALYSS